MTRYNIPRNFNADVNILGGMYKTRNLIEAGIILAILAPTVFLLLYAVDFGTRITITILIAVPPCFVALYGIHGDSLSQRLMKIMQYKKKKRACFYNPRIKEEKQPLDFSGNAFNLLPKDKINMYLEKYKNMNDEKLKEQIGVLVEERNNGMYFQDDDGVVEKPYDYMTAKEKRAYRKEQKRIERNKRNARKGKKNKKVSKQKQPVKKKAGTKKKRR